jgi:phospholipid/cholesterol/gamma-HCH transport system permease protein
MPNPDLPSLTRSKDDSSTVTATGVWRVLALAGDDVLAGLSATLAELAGDAALYWDLRGISRLDHIGAQLFWNAWGGARPPQLLLAPQHEDIFKRIEDTGALALPEAPPRSFWHFDALIRAVQNIAEMLFGFIALLGQFHLDLFDFVSAPLRGPWKEISAHVYHTGYQALGITALVGVLIGVVLSYLSAQQLHTFGGDIYLVNILGMSVIRELGPMLAAILVAGRSGSAITAQLGVMRVTEELDAMLVMGLPHGFRLIMPRVLALAIAMPLLVIWTDMMALIGGMIAAKVELGLSITYFLQKLPRAVPIENYFIGLGKGFVFGSLIALVSCYFGLRIRPNTSSLARGTTVAVVTAITLVIVADAVFAIVFRSVGY